MVHLTIKPFEYFAPRSIEGAISLLEEYGTEANVMAGGTDLIPKLRAREVKPKYVVDINWVEGLDYIKDDREGLSIGAVTTHTAILNSPIILKKALGLAEAVQEIGSVQIRNLGTIGGNLVNASPAADTAPILIVLGARLKVAGPMKERLVPVEDFFISVNKTVLRKDELLTEIQIPRLLQNTGSAFIKLGRRVGQDLSVASVAAAVTMEKDICMDTRIALGSVAQTPLRARKTESFLKGKRLQEEILKEASEIVTEEISPISDVRASREYRVEVSKVLVRRAIKSAVNHRGKVQHGRG